MSWYRREGDGYVVTQPVSWELGRPGSGLTVHVDEGFWFDVTVPRPFVWLFDPHNPTYLRAACFHDSLLLKRWNRVTAGAVFNETLKIERIARWRRFVMWLAVSLFKWS